MWKTAQVAGASPATVCDALSVAAQVLSERPDEVEVLFLAFDGPASWLPRTSRRIWHGARDRSAWEVRARLQRALHHNTPEAWRVYQVACSLAGVCFSPAK